MKESDKLFAFDRREWVSLTALAKERSNAKDDTGARTSALRPIYKGNVRVISDTADFLDKRRVTDSERRREKCFVIYTELHTGRKPC